MDKSHIVKLLKGIKSIPVKTATPRKILVALRSIFRDLGKDTESLRYFTLGDLKRGLKSILGEEIDKRVKSALKTQETALKAYIKEKLSLQCPSCKSFTLEPIHSDNGVFGPGFARWIVNYRCSRCGTIVDPGCKRSD